MRDRLREVKLPDGTRVVMTYDAFGRRLRKEVFTPGAARPRSVDFIWDGDAVAADLDSERGLRCFVHHPGTLMPLLQQERGEIFTYVNDQLGTPRELVDRGGLVAKSCSTTGLRMYWSLVGSSGMTITFKGPSPASRS